MTPPRPPDAALTDEELGRLNAVRAINLLAPLTIEQAEEQLRQYWGRTAEQESPQMNLEIFTMAYTLTPDELDRWNAARGHSGHAPMTMDEAQQKLDAMDEADRAFALAFIREGRL